MSNNKYDPEERTAKFGEEIIKLAHTIPKTVVNTPIVSQLVRAGTSVGANYCEADCAESKKDFEHKIGICNKESKESRHWLRMLAIAEPSLKDSARKLWKEASELNLIFTSIVRSARSNRSNQKLVIDHSLDISNQKLDILRYAVSSSTIHRNGNEYYWAVYAQAVFVVACRWSFNFYNAVLFKLYLAFDCRPTDRAFSHRHGILQSRRHTPTAIPPDGAVIHNWS